MSSQPSSSQTPAMRLVDGIACVVTQNWDARQLNVQLPAGRTPALPVRQGDRAWAFKVVNGYVYLHLFRDTKLRGWVPANILSKGEKYNRPLPIEISSQRSGTTFDASDVPSTDNVLRETLRCLWGSIKDNQAMIIEALPGLSADTRTALFHQNANRYADAVYDCLVPQARSIMQNGIFDPMNLGTLRQVDAAYPKEPGLYLRLYKDFGSQAIGSRVYSSALYVGQTVNFVGRDQSHRARANAASSSRSNHYRIANRAEKVRMIPILLDRNAIALPSRYLDVAEFSLVCLFRSWCPHLFAPSNANLMGSYGTDFDAASVFSQIMASVSQKTGWAPQVTLGLNWNTPIIKNSTSLQKWLSWYEEEDTMYMHRTRRQIRKESQGFVLHWHLKEVIQIPKELATAAEFKHGQTVHVVVELRKDKQGTYLSHPFRFVRLPSIGRNKELEKLKSLAIKIEWLPEGETEWKQCYLERTQMWGTISQTNILHLYRWGLMVLSDITQTTYTSGPAWIPPRGQAVVEFLEYDHLQQRLRAQNVRPRVVPWPQDYTMAENRARLDQMFPRAQFPDTIIGGRPGPGFFPPSSRRTGCDICLSQRTTSNKCQHNANDESCQCCRLINRPCTWSTGGGLMEDFVQGSGALEELAIAVNLTRTQGAMLTGMESAPFDPNMEAEDHAQLVYE